MLFGEKKEAKPRNMHEKKLNPLFIVIIMVSFSLLLCMSPTSLFYVSGTSIAMANHYPVDGETYVFVNHFLEQTTAVNTNTTVSVRIDSEPPVLMMYQGIRNEIVPGDTVARDWHTWSLTIPAMTEPGKHTFQFFRHYYVWQDADQYWGEFTSKSPVQSFAIAESSETPSPSPPPATINPIFPLTVITASAITAFLALTTFALRKRS